MIDSTAARPARTRSKRSTTRSLSRRIVLWVACASTILVVAVGIGVARLGDESIRAEVDHELRQAAAQGALLIDHELTNRRRQARLLASLPSIADAARAASARARTLGLDRLAIEELERRFADTRTLDEGERTRRFLTDRSASLDLAEVIVTESHGLNAVTTERPSDFVQRDEAWWQSAFRDDVMRASADYDESAAQTSISVAAPIRESAGGEPEGVIKLVYTLAPIREALAQASALANVDVDLIDEAGRLVASSAAASTALRPVPGALALRDAAVGQLVDYVGGPARRRAAVHALNDGAWRVVAHIPESVLASQLMAARLRIGAASVAALALLIGAVLFANRFLRRRLEGPAGELAAAAERVASGDLATPFTASDVNDEIGRLSRAVAKMIMELRSMASEMRTASHETAAMSAEITTGAEHMSAAAQQMAETSGDLSRQSAEMAETIQEMAADATRLSEVADALSAGAHDGVQRNRTLRTLAAQNGARLDESAHDLETLAGDVQRSAQTMDALVRASDGIAVFVTSVQRIARQSKLLALNASIEASRAGHEGEGFGVVANEVRRLAAGAAEEAGRTEALVADVLRQIAEAREAAARTEQTVENVRRATRAGLTAFSHVDQALAQTEPWTASIVETAARANALAGEATKRLDALSKGTEAFAAAMEEVAAATEEQSASTEEIAAASTSLATSAAKLRQLTAAFKLSDAEVPSAPVLGVSPRDSGATQARRVSGPVRRRSSGPTKRSAA